MMVGNTASIGKDSVTMLWFQYKTHIQANKNTNNQTLSKSFSFEKYS